MSRFRVCFLAIDGEIDFKVIGPRQAEAIFFRLAADFVVIHGEAGFQDDVVEPVQSRAAETEFFAKAVSGAVAE